MRDVVAGVPVIRANIAVLASTLHRQRMLELAGLRYMIAAEVLALICAAVCWWRVWKLPTANRVKIAALFTATVAGLRALALSIGIVATAL